MKIFLFLIIILCGIILFVFLRFQIWKIKENRQKWRVRNLGRDIISYQEKINGEWKKIEIDGEILMGEKSKVLYFKSEKKWSEYPEWAKNRAKIIERVKLKFPEKYNEYENSEI